MTHIALACYAGKIRLQDTFSLYFEQEAAEEAEYEF
jgi:hypothetical protein